MRAIEQTKGPTILELGSQFLKIGISAFGGYTALIAVVQKELVERKRWLTDEQMLDSISIASLLPGPLAVNVIAYSGYVLRGWLGALASMVAVLLPSFFIMIMVAIGLNYFHESNHLSNIIAGIIPVIVAIIFSVGIGLFKKQLGYRWQYLIFGLTLMGVYLIRGYLTIVVLMVIGGLVGLLMSSVDDIRGHRESGRSTSHLVVGLSMIVGLGVISFILLRGSILQALLVQFSTVSITLFGGGYVMIPLLYELIVDTLGWVNPTQFSTAIAVGQITPGPILISAAFIGYQVGGLSGAVIATISIFLPSALLMIVFSDTISKFGQSSKYKRFMQGVYPVVIAMILFSCYTLLVHQEQMWFSIIIAVVSVIIIRFTKINYLYLVLIMGLVGFFYYL